MQDTKSERTRFTFPRQTGRPPSVSCRLLCLGRVGEDGRRRVPAGDHGTSGGGAFGEALRGEQLQGLPVFPRAERRSRRKRWRSSGTSGCATELGIAGKDAADIRRLFSQGYQGSRYSFGYPACPNLEDQTKLFELLDGERIGVRLTDEFSLEPEQSTNAIIVHHPEARYFNVK